MIGKSMMLIAAGAMLAATTVEVPAQGIPVIDNTAILKHMESIAQLKAQLEALETQIAQTDQLLGSLNKISDMASLRTVLDQPAIRNALPEDFAAIEALLSGNGAGEIGRSASSFLESMSTYQTSANDFYAQELSRIQNRNAGQMSLGQQIYDTATRRIAGIEQLKQAISFAYDAKDIADLQARIQAESAFLQTDLLRMQGLSMVQQAQAQIEQQRGAEDWRRRLDAMEAALSQ